MSEVKYYTPTIEEFHVGFEYEQASMKMAASKKWHKEIFYLNDSHIDIVKYGSLDKNTRVKYLDQEDIEELGFTDKSTASREVFSKERLILDKVEPNKFRLVYNEDASYNSYLFYGTIKNKSELKKVLKQIGYESNKENS